MKAVRIHAHGGPEVMRLDEVELPPPGPGEARVRHTAIGVNFSDVNVRRGGFYPVAPPKLPLILGNEAAGVVEAVAPGVVDVRPGDRVAYAGMHGGFYEHTGAYAEARNVPVDRLVVLPDGVTEQQAAALMVKGLTAAMIVRRVFTPKPDDIILVHAAASGVGTLLCQWASHLGARVIGTVGNAGKAAIAEANGCDETILYREVDFVAAAKALTGGEGVSAVFDGVGKDTFVRSLDCIRPFGMAVNYGNASGHVPPLDLILLAAKGSLSVCRPGLHFIAGDTPSLRAAAADLFALVAQGVLKVAVSRTYPLAQAARAHEDVEGGRTTASLLLVP
ncbi:MAG TPA: quinone oxidoreductase [Hyphomicrobiales bacterium]|nr:quinone oxidoreductase [Hyphomicrobiales bacterium]